MSEYKNPFLTDQLRAGGIGGAGKFYELTPRSVSPVRFVGRDKLGRPIEDTVPTVFFRQFIMLDGGINKVPLRTCSEFKQEPEAVAYENQVTADLIQEGCLPLWVCPYTYEFKHITGGMLATPPPGVTDCGGKSDGCEHAHEIRNGRLAAALEKYKDEQRKVESMKFEQIQEMGATVAEGVGQAIAKHMASPPKAAHARLRNGQTDE